jgi:hypothetical protein
MNSVKAIAFDCPQWHEDEQESYCEFLLYEALSGAAETRERRRIPGLALLARNDRDYTLRHLFTEGERTS